MVQLKSSVMLHVFIVNVPHVIRRSSYRIIPVYSTVQKSNNRENDLCDKQSKEKHEDNNYYELSTLDFFPISDDEVDSTLTSGEI